MLHLHPDRPSRPSRRFARSPLLVLALSVIASVALIGTGMTLLGLEADATARALAVASMP
jgi:hypothetical protein